MPKPVYSPSAGYRTPEVVFERALGFHYSRANDGCLPANIPLPKSAVSLRFSRDFFQAER